MNEILDFIGGYLVMVRADTTTVHMSMRSGFDDAVNATQSRHDQDRVIIIRRLGILMGGGLKAATSPLVDQSWNARNARTHGNPR